jgi:hypothetical protein
LITGEYFSGFLKEEFWKIISQEREIRDGFPFVRHGKREREERTQKKTETEQREESFCSFLKNWSKGRGENVLSRRKFGI